MDLNHGKKKLQAVELVCNLVKNNIYQPESIGWIEFRTSLFKLTINELNAMYAVIMGCHDYTRRQVPALHKFPDLFVTK